jgi:hypothetical protein
MEADAFGALALMSEGPQRWVWAQARANETYESPCFQAR